MKQIALTTEQLELVKDILSKHLPQGCKVWVFGSRAKGTARQYSDLDLALEHQGNPLPPAIMTELSFDFEHSLLPYKVDIIDLNEITDNFKKNIQADLVQLR